MQENIKYKVDINFYQKKKGGHKLKPFKQNQENL